MAVVFALQLAEAVVAEVRFLSQALDHVLVVLFLVGGHRTRAASLFRDHVHPIGVQAIRFCFGKERACFEIARQLLLLAK